MALRLNFTNCSLTFETRMKQEYLVLPELLSLFDTKFFKVWCRFGWSIEPGSLTGPEIGAKK